jgi:hypothetical protein
MDSNSALGALGLGMPSPAYLAGLIIFSILGYGAWRYGKQAERPVIRWGGLVLMLYSYLTSETWLLYAVGVGICGTMYAFRNR